MGEISLQKSVSIFIIFILVLNIFSPPLPHYLRAHSFKVLQAFVNAYLNYQTRDFYALESENFIIKYTKQDKESISFTAGVVEKYYSAVKKQFSYSLPEEKTLIVIYPNQEALNESLGLRGDKSAAGVYWAGSIRLLSPYGWNSDASEKVTVQETVLKKLPISHELTHRLIDTWTGGNYTRWLTEGLAQYIEEQVAGFRLDEPMIEEKENLYSLKSLDSDFDQQENQLLAYWQSLQTVKYLLSNYGMKNMQNLLNELSWGEKTDNAIEKVYGFTISELEYKTKAYIENKNGEEQ